MENNEKLMVAGLLVAAVIITAAVMSFTLTVPSKGKLKKIGVEIYTDSAGTIKLNEIDWGILGPGDVAQVTAYMKSIGNKPSNVTMTTQNWNPAIASSYITLTWDYPPGRILQPGEMIAVKFTLTVSESIKDVDSFSFDIVITSTG